MMNKGMRSDKAQIANGKISSCIVEGTPVSKLRAQERLLVVIMGKVAALVAWVITSRIRPKKTLKVQSLRE
jgi:hypothetical protein